MHALPNFRAAVVLAVAAVACIGTAQAQQPNTQLRAACRGDYQSYCSGTKPGGGRIIACLQKNAASLSTPCQQALAAMRPNPS